MFFGGGVGGVLFNLPGSFLDGLEGKVGTEKTDQSMVFSYTEQV